MDSRFPLQLDSIGETLALPHVTASRLVAASELIIVGVYVTKAPAHTVSSPKRALAF